MTDPGCWACGWSTTRPISVSSRRSAPCRPEPGRAPCEPGFTEAWLTDVEDDSYDLSWFNDLPESDVAAIGMLQRLLETDPDPIDRHFQYAELETRLYRCRDLYDSALDEYDIVCQRHDAEMDVICQAFLNKWSKVPLLQTYRQMAIRQQKRKDWRTCLWWTERGLALYGDVAARQDAVEDLLKRRNRALAKLDQQSSTTTRLSPGVIDVGLATEETPAPRATGAFHGDIEVLVCRHCDARYERLRVRGRKPQLCPDCRLRTDA